MSCKNMALAVAAEGICYHLQEHCCFEALGTWKREKNPRKKWPVTKDQGRCLRKHHMGRHLWTWRTLRMGPKLESFTNLPTDSKAVFSFTLVRFYKGWVFMTESCLKCLKRILWYSFELLFFHPLFQKQMMKPESTGKTELFLFENLLCLHLI